MHILIIKERFVLDRMKSSFITVSVCMLYLRDDTAIEARGLRISSTIHLNEKPQRRPLVISLTGFTIRNIDYTVLIIRMSVFDELNHSPIASGNG